MPRNKWLLWLRLFWYNMQNLIWLCYVWDTHTHIHQHTYTCTLKEKTWRDVLLATVFQFFIIILLQIFMLSPCLTHVHCSLEKKKCIFIYIIGG